MRSGRHSLTASQSGKRKPHAESKQIINDLTELLGDDIHQVINLAGEIIPEALNVLVGQPVDIEIEHHHGKNHAEPFCMVSQVTKPGGLIEQLKEAA